jgi:hypothetical protein
MSHPLTLLRGIADATAIAILLGLGFVGTAKAQHCPHPATPCPCCADGMCYPKRDTWGNYTTNWRPWPGQTTGIPTTPEEQQLEGAREQLPIFLRPRPDQEDLRGPARPVRPAAPGVQTEVNEQAAPLNGLPPIDGAAPPAGQQEAPPLDEAPAPAPEGGIDLPGFGPQGSLQSLPRIEEGPPSLPKSLGQAITSQQRPESQQSTASQPSTVKANIGSRYVTPTSNTAAIELTNPAAKHVQKMNDEDLEHAIYYEQSEETLK